jgi:hypothetical protein
MEPFWSALKDGRPDSSSATTSPSSTVSSGIDPSAFTRPGYLALKSLSLRERS